MKKLLALFLACLFVLSLAACSGKAENADGEKFTVGICQLVQHDALDAATNGFIDALNEALPGKVEFQNQNASGEIPNCTTIINGFVSDHVDLILANATPALQAAAAGTAEIPILGTSITDYASALEIDNWTGTVGGNISGTSDLAPLQEQAQMIQELFPDAKKIGILYCSSEVNSQYQVDQVTKYLTDAGISCTPFAFTDTNDVSSVAQAACAASDVIYIPTDNVAASNTEAISNILLTENVPAVVGESNICKGCGVATLSIDYYELGRITGQMAAKILRGEENISDMPIAFAPNVSKVYNPEICEHFGLTVPDGYSPID